MTTLRTAAQQALEALEYCEAWDHDMEQQKTQAITALKAVLAEPVLQTCNCRWDGEVQVQQCTLHEAHVDAIHEWAERAKTAEKKLAALAEQRLTDMEQKMERSIESLKTALAEPTLSQQLAAAGFTRRDTRLECDECGGKFTRQMLPIHKCEPVQEGNSQDSNEPVAWIHTDPDMPRVKFLEWRENEPGYRGDWIKTPLFTAPGDHNAHR